MLVNKSSNKLHEDIKINSNNSTIKGENFMKIGWGMTSWEYYENKWFYMKYIRKHHRAEICLTPDIHYGTIVLMNISSVTDNVIFLF